MTPCAPILKQRTESDPVDPEFYGALCMDINPSGPLNAYFPFEEGEEATYMLFNSDEAFDSITDIEDSQLAEYI